MSGDDQLQGLTAAEKATLRGILAKVKAGQPLKRWEAKRLEEWELNQVSSIGQSVADYKAKRDRLAKKKKDNASSARDIAPLRGEPCENFERWKACEKNFQLFCETYFPEQFKLGWSDDHLRVIAKIEQAVLTGGLFAMAMPRGSGKTTLAECAALWAVLYGHRGFVVLIGSDQASAIAMLDSLKTELETNELLFADFKRAIQPIVDLDGIPHRAGGQVFEGQRTHIGWTAEEIILPTMKGSASSGAIIRVAGITGRIRGMKFKKTDGRSVRPDLVVLDDPQTDESARSVSQSEARVAVLSGAILGLAGPGKKISGIMPCTVIRPGDMADRILDTQKHPEWNGERTKLVYSWPTNSRLWEEYARIRADNLRRDGTIADATAYYVANQAAMDDGARVAWAARFNPDEASAVQNAMNLRLQDEAAFFAEYQNDPMPEAEASDEGLNSDLVASRLNGHPFGELPTWANRITAFIDVQQKALWYVVCAWSDRCDGAILEYGTYPEQGGRQYFTLRDLKISLAHVVKGAGLEGQITEGLDRLTQALLARRWKLPEGTEMGIERLLVDANWGQQTETVYEFCRRSTLSALVIPSHGRYVGASSQPMGEWKRKPGEKMGHNWRIAPAKRRLRAITYDTNSWKSWIAARWLTSPGDPGTLTMWGKDPERHRMMADHCSAEHRVRTTGRGRTVDEWRLKPGRDNHLFDGVIGCAVAASVQGMPAAPIMPNVTGDKPSNLIGKEGRMSFAALQRQARAKTKKPA